MYYSYPFMRLSVYLCLTNYDRYRNSWKTKDLLGKMNMYSYHFRLTTESICIFKESIRLETIYEHKYITPKAFLKRNTLLFFQRLLKIGNIEEAFSQALVANDLSVVVYTCEEVDMSVIFNDSPCPLSQSVLLSLIQQLSHELQVKNSICLTILFKMDIPYIS